MTRVAIVTGGNKGIGFGVVRGLCKEFKGDVYLTARDEGRGLEAVEALKKEGLTPKFHQLDILSDESVKKIGAFIVDNYGGLDVLVNNAGIAYKNASTAPFSEQVEVTLKTNFFATLNVCKVLFPLLRSHARVVHLSSGSSLSSLTRCSSALQTSLKSCDSLADLGTLMVKFEQDVKNGVHEVNGWPSSAYGVSKIGVTVMTPIQQAELDADKTRSDLVVNCCCPGYVDTDMSSHKGPKTIDEGAVTPIYLALLPPDCTEPRGEYVTEKKVVKWR
ncbi:Carbonyl reductase [NADPH] 3 [Lamellibrachia satsuma]|nr:Carbonyl reductase [NADPH] 3 [Lamellibrachia satsuma]